MSILFAYVVIFVSDNYSIQLNAPTIMRYFVCRSLWLSHWFGSSIPLLPLSLDSSYYIHNTEQRCVSGTIPVKIPEFPAATPQTASVTPLRPICIQPEFPAATPQTASVTPLRPICIQPESPAETPQTASVTPLRPICIQPEFPAATPQTASVTPLRPIGTQPLTDADDDDDADETPLTGTPLTGTPQPNRPATYVTIQSQLVKVISIFIFC